MGMLKVFIPGPAVGKGRPKASRHGKGIRMRTPEKTKAYEAEVAWRMKAALPRGYVPTKGPVSVAILVVDGVGPRRLRTGALPKPAVDRLSWKAEPKRSPDLDNIVKAILDAGNKVIWNDDGQVYGLSTLRVWGLKDGVWVMASLGVDREGACTMLARAVHLQRQSNDLDSASDSCLRRCVK